MNHGFSSILLTSLWSKMEKCIKDYLNYDLKMMD